MEFDASDFSYKIRRFLKVEDWAGMLNYLDSADCSDLYSKLEVEQWKTYASIQREDFHKAEEHARTRVDLMSQVKLDKFGQASILTSYAGILARNGKIQEAQQVIAQIQGEILFDEPEIVNFMKDSFHDFCGAVNKYLWPD